jgi:hypothetical protein
MRSIRPLNHHKHIRSQEKPGISGYKNAHESPLERAGAMAFLKGLFYNLNHSKRRPAELACQRNFRKGAPASKILDGLDRCPGSFFCGTVVPAIAASNPHV